MDTVSDSSICILSRNFSFGISVDRKQVDDRTPESDDEQVYEGEDDPYLNQIEAFVEDVEQGGEIHRILSTFQDAVKTYEFTWRIKDASERK
jgi:predicted dehydrogenase